MKLTISQETLNKYLQISLRHISNRTAFPILSHVLIKAKSDGLIFHATNGDNLWRAFAPAKVDQEGEITVPAKNITEFVGTLKNNSAVGLTLESDTLVVSSANFKAKFLGVSAQEFPSVDDLDKGKQTTYKLTREFLESIIGKCLFASAQDESRPVLTGILFKMQADHLQVIATDGFRMSKLMLPKNQFLDRDMIIPSKALIELAKLISDFQSKALDMFYFDASKQLIFSDQTFDYRCRILEGNFPDVNKVIPKESKTEVVVDRNDLLRAIRASTVFAKESNNIIALNILSDKIVVSSKASNVGENEMVVDAKMDGEAVQASFNYRYVYDFLNSIPDGTVKIKLTDGLSACVWQQEENANYVHVIMPVRT